MLRIGLISEIDAARCYARVKFLDNGIVSDWLQVVVMGAISNKFFHIFDINEQVACLMDENDEEGVILGALFNDKTSPGDGNKDVVKVNFSDDSFIEYNRSAHEYNIDIKGKINIAAQSDVKITSDTLIDVEALNATVKATVLAKVEAPAIELNGAVTINGNLALGGSVSGISGAPISGNIEATGDVKAGTVSLKTHVHAGVTTGSGSTAIPTP